MNRAIYKSSFKNIAVSDNTINEVMLKANLYKGGQTHKRRSFTKIMIPVTALIAASIITVTAAPDIGIANTFKGFFQQFFGTEMSDKQLSIAERYGSTPDKTFSKDGVGLNLEGVIGDNNHMYIKYSVSTDKEYNPMTHSSIMAYKLYVGDLKEGISPVSVGKTSVQDEAGPNRSNYAAIFSFEQDIPISAKEATFVIKDMGRYQSSGINLKKTYEKYGISNITSKNIYDLPDMGLDLLFDSKYGEILLKSIGYTDGQLILAVDKTGYYEVPAIYLRDKKTGSIYYRSDNSDSVSRNNLYFYPFKIDDINQLGNLEIVMRDEYYFSFPLSYTDRTKTFDLSKQDISLDNTKISKIKLSPISLTIYGTTSKDPGPSFATGGFAIKLKDNTILDNFKYGGSRYGNSDGSFRADISFNAPIEVEDIDTLIIKSGDKMIEIPISY